jgi:membrane protein
MGKLQRAIEWVQGLKPVRVFMHYSESRGPLLAAGLSFQSLFALFAALWVGFSVAGLVLRANSDLLGAFLTMLNTSVPGLIDTGDGGMIDPRVLFESATLSWTGAIALAGLLFTALGWLASCRDAVRTIFGLPGELTNFALLKLKDAGLGLAFGVALVVSSALLVVSTQLAGSALEFLGFDRDSTVTVTAGTAIGLVLMFLLDTATLSALFRLLSGLAIPLRRLLVGALLGAAALGILKLLGTALLGGATRNPLLASFAVIIGLLIWFNLICQVILISASWISVGMADAGLIADPKIEAERRREQQREAEKLAAQRAEAEARAIAALPWWRRMFVRSGRDRGAG